MCTALSIKSEEGKHFFGRNMDLSYEFNQSVLIIPKEFKYQDRVTRKMVTIQKAIIGMGTVIEEHPAMADAMNEDGLACAGLNFAGYAYYEEIPVEGKINIAPYDLILWVLSNFSTVAEVKQEIRNIELINVPINEKIPVATLHWMITDKTGNSIVIEKTKEKIAVYENPVGVMTNNPTFDWHLTNLNEYINLTPAYPNETKWSNQRLTALGVGAGNLGIPGDFASVSRFVRIAYIRAHMPSIENDSKAVSQFFHMLDYVKMVKGGVITEEGLEDFTMYSSCMDQENGIYYYRTYHNSRINAVDLKKEKLIGKEIKAYSYCCVQDINYQN